MSLPLLSLLFFFFYCYADHRDLHSFPTRRSSDLEIPSRCRCSCARCSTISRVLKPFPASAISGWCSAHAARSEEHTSELQSRRDLVCRLLLEKKKKTKTTKPNIHNKNIC